MVNPRTLFVRFVKRNSERGPAIWSKTIKARKWNFVATTYDMRRKTAKLYVNNRFVKTRKIGGFKLATNYPARMGARRGDKRYFKGAVSCLQIFKEALNSRKIFARKRRCFTSTFLLL